MKEMKTYVCRRCGKKFEGRHEYCPRCGQHFVYQREGKLYDAYGSEVLLDKKGHIRKTKLNPNLPK